MGEGGGTGFDTLPQKSRGTWHTIGNPNGPQISYQTLTYKEHIGELAESIDHLMNSDSVYTDVFEYIKENPKCKREKVYEQISFHGEPVSEKDLNEVIDVLEAAGKIEISDKYLTLNQKVK